MASKKFIFRATYGGSMLPEKKLAIVAVDFSEALKKATDAIAQINTGMTSTNGGALYDLMALKRGEIIDVE